MGIFEIIVIAVVAFGLGMFLSTFNYKRALKLNKPMMVGDKVYKAVEQQLEHKEEPKSTAVRRIKEAQAAQG